MASSAIKIVANRANASLSTGPVDTSRTRFNGLTHGLTSKQTVVHGESRAEYDTFQSDLHAELQPRTATEKVLADRVIAAAWRLKRFTRVENAFFNNRIDAILEANPESDPDAAMATLFTDPAEMARMRLFLRYQTAVQREYDKAFKEFQTVKAERDSQDVVDETESSPGTADEHFGFASQTDPAAVPSGGYPAQFAAAHNRM